jgi:hypothetical protein
LSETDAQKVCISAFDEDDPKQHTMKILFGCGVYFGFRGRLEHHALEKAHIGVGTFEKGHRFEDMQYVGVRVINDKTNRITLHNPYSRDTGKLMRMPILDKDPTSSCFGGSLLRYIEKMNPNQKWLHCRGVLESCRALQHKKGLKGFYYENLKLGAHSISKLFKEGAGILGILSEDFCPHSLRALFITTMVNDGSVSNKESMRAARHTSIKAHLDYMETGQVSEGNRIQCLLDARPDKQKSPGPTLKMTTPKSVLSTSTPATANSTTSSVGKPGFGTQMEWASFCRERKELGIAMGLEIGSSQDSQTIDIEKAKRDLECMNGTASRRSKKKSKLRRQIEDLSGKLEEKKEQFESASTMFDRVIEKERLYRRELDGHYEEDTTRLRGEINNLWGQQEVDRSCIVQLQRENDQLKVENERLLGLYSRRRVLYEGKENSTSVKPRRLSTSVIRNPYIRKSAGPSQTPNKKPDSSLSSQVINPYKPRTYYR